MGTLDRFGPPGRSAAAPLAARTGFWGAVLTATFALLFGVGAALAALVFPGREWQGAERWSETYSVAATYLTVLPSFLLTFAFLVLMASVHVLATDDGRVLSLVGLSLAVAYAAILDVNYFVQLTFVRQQVLAGRGATVGLLAIEDASSLFWTIEYLGYGLQCLAALAVAPLFRGWTRGLLVLLGGVGVLSLAAPMLDLPLAVVIVGGAAWLVAMPAVAILLARQFSRLEAGAAGRARVGG